MKKSLSIIRVMAAGWNAIFRPMPLVEFDDYDAYWERRQKEGRIDRILHRHLIVADRICATPSSKVLDIGCGDGAFLRYLRQREATLSCAGAELSEKAVLHLRESGITGFVLDPNKSLREQIHGQFDDIVLMEVIEHIPDAEKFMRQVLQLGPKRLFITIPNCGYIIHRLRLALGGRFPITAIMYHMKEHVRFWTVRDFHEWSVSLGLQVTNYTGQENVENPLVKCAVRVWPSLFAGQIIYELRVGKPNRV
jgi:methionine biosynthesis protein MetW